MSNSSCIKKRVIGLISGNNSGKTSLSECFLFNSGAINRLGKIESKNTISDYSPLETKRGFSINSSILNYEWKNFKINLIDAPGYMDFISQTLSAIKVIDGVLLVIDAKSGVQAPTERVLGILSKDPKPMFCVINKLDQENIDYFKVVNNINKNFKLNLVPITIPLSEGENFSSIADLLKNLAYNYQDGSFKSSEIQLDENNKDKIENYHNSLIESIVETDDDLLNKYLDGKEIDSNSINEVLKKAVIEKKVIPVFAVSSGKNIGVDILMDYINSLFPSPLEIKPLTVKNINNDTEIEIKPSPDGPALAYVFKTMADPYIGKLSIFRIFSGTFKLNGNYCLSSKKGSYKFSNLFKLQGKEQIDISEAACGDIIAVSKITDISNDDTISTQENLLEIEKIQYPEPILPKAILPVSKGDEEKISNGLSKLSEEDPTLKQELNLEVKQNFIWGTGELHLLIIKDNLKQKFDIDVNMITPDVAYKETIKKDAKSEHKYKKQSGGRGQYGHVFLELKPLKKGEGFKFENSIFGGAIPKGYIPGVEKGIRESLNTGVIAGYPVVDISVNLYDGSFHSVDSSELAFKIAASMAFKKGMKNASPIILEPVMEIEVTVPEKYMGDIIGDINSKRGKIITMTPDENKTQIIKATIPQSESFNYSVDLISITQGRGIFKQKFSHYEELPPNLANDLVKERDKEKE